MRLGNITLLFCLSFALLFFCVNSQTPSCTNGWFGPGCKYKCRCVNNTCDVSGSCTAPFTCQGGWFGPACQYADVAYSRSLPLDFTDGNDKTCTPTTSILMPFDKAYFFTWMRVIISDQALAEDVKLEVTFAFNTTRVNCADLKTYVMDNSTVDLHCNLTETIDELTLDTQAALNICSIYISGDCFFGKFGQFCNETCSENCFSPANMTYCNISTGACLLGCKTGFQGDSCQDKCPAGKYGDNCNASCSPNCMSNGVADMSPCDHVTGNCRKGCRVGFSGGPCLQECPAGKFGGNCSSSCSPNCKPTGVEGMSPCDPATGDCRKGCQVGFGGNSCLEASVDATFGTDIASIAVGVCLLFAAIAFFGYCFCKKRAAPPSAERKRGSVQPELFK